MKKLLILILLGTIVSCTKDTKSSDSIRLQLTEMEGYGPFPQMFGRLSWTPISEKGIWAKTALKTTGVPEVWSTSNVAQIWFDSHQFAYQNYALGNLSEKTFRSIQNAWKIDLEKRKLSESPINCFVHIAMGVNKKGQLEYIIDTDNDKDFSDEIIHTPKEIGKDLDFNKAIKESQTVVAEISTNTGVQKKEIKILVLSNGRGNLIYNFPQMAKTTYLNKEILVSNGFGNITYNDKSSITLSENTTEIVEVNEFIHIDNTIYKNLGVDINTNQLHLLKMPVDTIIYSSKVGFNAKPFTVKQLHSNDSLKLKDFKSKLLYLDFWGTWCVPCIADIPDLKKAYDATRREDIEFLGVAVFDTKEKLKSAIEKYQLNWPQVLDSDATQFKESYNVTDYPTSFLIDQKGKIIAKNLRSEHLLDTLNFYLKKIK